MKNKEVLRSLKDAAVATLEHYYYGQKVTRVELDGEKYKELCNDLAKGAEYEEYMKIALNSVYGVGCVAKPYCERDVEFIQKVCTSGIKDMWPSLAGFVDSGEWKELYNYSLRNSGFRGPNGMFIATVKDNTPKVMFNGPCTIFQWGDFKTVVKYVEDKKTKDKFDVDIGLGIALYRYYRQAKSTRKQFDKLAKYLDLYQLADYALDYFCDFSKKKRNGLFNDEPVNGWYRLDK